MISARILWTGALFCALALGAHAGSESASLPPDPPPAAGSFTALSYNVHGLPWFLTRNATLDRLRRIAPRLEAYDVVALQEDFLDAGHALLAGASSHATRLRFATVGPGRAYGSGLTLLARARNLMHHHEHYRHCNGRLIGSSDCVATKGLQMVRLRLAPGAEVDVYNSHLEAGRGPADVAARAGNVAQIIAAMRTLSAGRAIVFLGDTNLRPGDPGDRPLIREWTQQLSLRDACAELSCPEPGLVDRVYLRDGARLRLTVDSWSDESRAFLDDDGVPLSDHRPIAVGIAWQRLGP